MELNSVQLMKVLLLPWKLRLHQVTHLQMESQQIQLKEQQLQLKAQQPQLKELQLEEPQLLQELQLRLPRVSVV